MKRNNVKQITIRLTADEYAHVKQLSKDSGLKMEPAIRRLIMGVNLRPRPPDELPELLRQLSGIGTNINQKLITIAQKRMRDKNLFNDAITSPRVFSLVTVCCNISTGRLDEVRPSR